MIRRYSPIVFVAAVGVVLFGVFYLTPMVYLLRTSFWQYSSTSGSTRYMIPVFTLANYVEVLTGTYLHYTILTIKIGLVCTVAAVILSYPLAYWFAKWSGYAKLKRIVLITLIASFLVGTIARVFAWYSMLTGTGFVAAVLSLFGIGEVHFIGTEFAVELCQVQYLMSIATLSLISPLKNVDPMLEEASKSLGGGEIRTFINVTLPLSLPGVVAASLLCFAVSVSAFVTPMVLGAGGIVMVSNLVYTYYLDIMNYPLGSAFAVILLSLSFISMYVLEKALLSRVRT